MRDCIKCGGSFPLTGEFFGPDGHGRVRRTCRKCVAAYQRAQYAKDPDKCLKMSARWRLKHPERHPASTRKALYGLADSDYRRMLAEQNSLCAICGGPPTTARKHLSVDHCHSTGKVRGLLCQHCNTGIGQLKDSPELLLKAHAYLLKFSS